MLAYGLVGRIVKAFVTEGEGGSDMMSRSLAGSNELARYFLKIRPDSELKIRARISG